ncbi:hypothetical protein DCC39_02190 [Pueribacillus theae]|uniref:Uracil-DNA glycosylase-like domain-containing protein n=1 Tax=Pueribacillus theae TaxID=2171751 RepID=A0A2U1K6W7_9BACI|nr:hypothetical protein [Pueribacillus theae]PWA13276.1 hypothetical protein DCC39_02190 [Pueribacillus theae]
MEKKEFVEIIEELSKNYTVKSFLPEKADFIFMLESPHIQELKHNIPVAGSSGATMSKNLFGEQYNKPLGLLVKKNMEIGFERKTLNKIGLFNVSEIPLQRKAYKDKALEERYHDFFDNLEKVRSTNHKINYESSELNELQQVLLDRFKGRLAMLLDRKCTIVPCGRFAQKFFRLANLHGVEWTVIHDVPHPSYNSWSQEKYRAKIQELKDAFYSEI